MSTLNRSQFGLLNLLVKEQGAGIALVRMLALSYGVEEGRLGPDLLRLVEERLIWPAGSIRPQGFLPSLFLPSPEGRRLLEVAAEEGSDKVPSPDLGAIARIHSESNAGWATPQMPALQTLPKEVVMILAGAYLHWAQKPPTDAPRTSSHQLYMAAAWGFAHVNETERYSRALRAGLKAWVAEGLVAQVARHVDELVVAYPSLAGLTLEMASVVLEPTARLLCDAPPSPLESTNSLHALVQAVGEAAVTDARTLRLRLPESQYLVEVGLSLEKTFVQAFALQSRPLYLTAAKLLLLTIRQARSMVDLSGSVGKVLPQVVRMTLGAEQVALAMEGFADLVDEPPEVRRRAGNAVAVLARSLLQATVIPLAHLVNLGGGAGAQVAQWTLKMLHTAHRGLALRIARPLLYLERLELRVAIGAAPASSLEYLVSGADVAQAAADAQTYLARLPLLDPRTAQFLPLSGSECDALERVVDYLRLAQAFPQSFPTRCDVLRSSLQFQLLADRALRPLLSEMHQKTLDWMVLVRQSERMAQPRKTDLLRQLGEMEKANTPSHYLLRTPALIESWELLGPGDVLDTFNSWLDNARRSEIL